VVSCGVPGLAIDAGETGSRIPKSLWSLSGAPGTWASRESKMLPISLKTPIDPYSVFRTAQIHNSVRVGSFCCSVQREHASYQRCGEPTLKQTSKKQQRQKHAKQASERHLASPTYTHSYSSMMMTKKSISLNFNQFTDLVLSFRLLSSLLSPRKAPFVILLWGSIPVPGFSANHHGEPPAFLSPRPSLYGE
jgi:hypothetical protein